MYGSNGLAYFEEAGHIWECAPCSSSLWPKYLLIRGSGGGQLVPGTVARVIKQDGSLCGYDEPGELMIKSPTVALGYANNEQAYVGGLFSITPVLNSIFSVQRKHSLTGMFNEIN